MSTPSPLTICVTGNIASGKTSLAQSLADADARACLVPEPFETNQFLPLYLREPPRWGFTETLYYFWDYARAYARAREDYQCSASRADAYYLVDAGVWTNAQVYTEYMRETGIINAAEFAFYQTLTALMAQAYNVPEPAGYIFVQASPEICWQRMHARGWDYQIRAIQRAYIETLPRYFDKMRSRVRAAGTPVLEISSEAMDWTTESGRAQARRVVGAWLEFVQRVHQRADA